MRSRAWLQGVLIFVAAAALMAPAGGCHRSESGGKRIGVSLLTEQHDFYKDLEAGMRKAAKEKGLQLLISSAEFDSARQATQLENFITEKVDAIVVCPCDSTSVAQVIEKVNKAGIPVFTADIAAEGGKVVCHVASDNVQGGKLAADTMAKLLNGKGDIIIIDHPEVASVQDRVRGFTQEITKWPEIHIVGRPSASGTRDKAFAVAQNKLQANPDLRGIFGINDDSALGALRAVGDRKVAIVGYDATPEARDAIRRGSALKADVVQYPEKIGVTTIDMIAKYLSGKRDEVPAIVPIPVGIVDRAKLQAGS